MEELNIIQNDMDYIYKSICCFADMDDFNKLEKLKKK